jgi:trimethyllysine dioxygenase
MVKLVGAHPIVRGVRLKFEDPSIEVELDALWLRDHDQSVAGMDPVTHQRRTDTMLLPDDLEVRATEIQDEGRWIEVTWAEHLHTTRHEARMLYKALDPDQSELPTPMLWDTPQQLPSLPHIPFDTLDTSEGLQELFRQMWSVGFCLVESMPATTQATEQLVRKISYPRSTVFGGMWTFGATGEYDDTAYSSVALPLHTDGTYTFDPPGWQLFQCLRYDGTGGMSTLADGFAQVRAVQSEFPDAFQTLCDVKVVGEYRGDGVHLRATHPVVTLDAQGRLRRIMYNNADRAAFRRSPEESRRFYAAYRALGRRFLSPDIALQYALRPGTTLIVDNWRVLHGRTAFTGQRVLTGAYINREDVESRWRSLCAE